MAKMPMRLSVHELQLRLQKIERRFENLERPGEIVDTKYDKEKKRWYVKMNDGEDKTPSGQGEDKEGNTFKSDWRPWQSFSHNTISISIPPKKGMKVMYKSPGGYPEQGYITPYHYGPETPSPHDKEDEVVIQIRKPKKDKDQSQTSSPSGSSSSSVSSSSGDDTEDQNDNALRVRSTKDGMVFTVGKLGDAQDASASDGDGADKNDQTTFQMKISRDAKTITCGKFKATIGKDGAKLSYDDKVSFNLSSDSITSEVDGTKHTIVKGKNTFTDGRIEHDGKNIGKDHRHGQTMPGGGTTGDPEA